ncbi:sodium/calcium exchanger 1-like protein [Leptotrombidium deliense]|uniref:Sodium/calcium exchanger 1-like protein n=1 Tax=Leptotrombidium deliense TaxID=299467 RepID=A0A443SEA8_9ACAR|nr:sodium/calcium exchanger 1-like protein [Leptotrombidium deliense]
MNSASSEYEAQALIEPGDSSTESEKSETANSKNNKTTKEHVCKDGLVIPAWRPIRNLSNGEKIARGLVYFLSLVYLFVGVSIIADRFMAAIEVITSQEREVTIKKPNGETQVISVRIWNETVSNLTLMALGSSAPEILLSIIEVYAQDYQAGELGPGTIVGSAAFNMFVIIAICVWCVPSTETKKIKHLRVFFVTMVWSVFAYVWLLAILSWFSEGVVEIWEGLLTFAFFPLTVITAYIADRRMLIYKYLSKKYRMNKRGVVVATEGLDNDDMEMGMKGMANHIPDGGLKVFDEEANEEVKEFEETRREFISILRDLRKKHPDAPIEEIEMMAREDIFNRGPKSRAFYRLQATKKLTGGAAPYKRRVEKFEDKKDEKDPRKDENVVKISFNPAHYTVLENVGQFAVTVSREGDLTKSVAVDFKTEDGTANAGSDFEPIDDTLIFRPGEAHKQVYITVIDDDVFEEDEHFYCRLSNPRYIHSDSQMNGGPGAPSLPELQLSTPAIATVMILDDDHGGVFAFAEQQYEVSEAVGVYMLPVSRFSGARGKVYLPFKTIEGSAKEESDFIATEGEVVFENNESK